MPGLLYPVWRLVIIASGLATAVLLYAPDPLHPGRQCWCGAGATKRRQWVSALGVDIRRLFMIVFGFGTMLAGFAGVMIAPILSVEPGMGDTILILAFVVIVIGGIGSIRGAFLAAIMVGLVDTLGALLRGSTFCGCSWPPPRPATVGPAIASMLIYLLMAIVLYVRPAGLVSGAGTLNGRDRPDRDESRAPAGPYPPTPSCRCCCFRSSRWCRSSPAKTYLLDRFIRIMIFAIAAIGLDLLVGYGPR